MDNLFVASDGSASALASVRLYQLGFAGIVRSVTSVVHDGAVEHQCIRFRDTRQEAIEDARADARTLVRMWSEECSRPDDDF